MAVARHGIWWLVLIAGIGAWGLALTVAVHLARGDDPRPPSLESLMEQKRYDEAIARLRWMLARAPSTQHLTRNLIGNAYLAQERYDEAIRHYRGALETAPDFGDAHNNLGVALARSGRPVEAMLAFEQALRVQPQYTEARSNLARAVSNYEARAGNGPVDPEVEAVLRRVRGLVEEAGSAPRAARAGAAVAEGDARVLEQGRVYLRLFRDGALAELHGSFSKSFASRMSLDDLRTLRDRVDRQLGAEIEILRDRALIEDDGQRFFVRLSRFEGFAGLVEQSVAMGEDSAISGFRIRTTEEP